MIKIPKYRPSVPTQKKEMTAVEYLRDKATAVCNCEIDCDGCPLGHKNNGTGLSCHGFERKYPKEAIAIVQTWAKEHPKKTILMDLLEKYPNVRRYDSGVPYQMCPYKLGYEPEGCNDDMDCWTCWNRPLKEAE